MEYGYFDVKNKEYVITRPDTPTPWINYLGNGKFSGIISNNGGGLLFDGDPGNRRLTRYKYNNLPMDRPGRYIYIRDMENGEYWSATWQPVMKKPEFYECRHGLGYTTIKYSYSGIQTEITYYIPEGKNYEIWSAKIKNNSGVARKIKLFSYIEFSYARAEVDISHEWARYEMLCDCVDDTIIFDPAAEVIPTGRMYGFMATDLPVDGFECWRDNFIGAYRSEANPIMIEKGELSNTNIDADHPCGSLSSSMTLEPDEEKEFIFTLGAAGSKEEIPALKAEATDRKNADELFIKLKNSWEKHLSNCQVKTPDEDMNKMLNIWHAYQCKMTFDWSRFISYYERGIVRGLGLRDSMQDVLGVMHVLSPQAKERIKTLLKIQKNNGNSMDVYFPANGNTAGGGRSDSHLWAIFSVCTYIRETGDYDFLNERVEYLDGGDGSVIEHLKASLNFTRENVGAHGIPKFLHCDWNDSIALIGKGKKAESTFVFFQAAHAAYELKLLFAHIKDEENLKWAEEYYQWCRNSFDILWDGKWFLRAFLDNGDKFGTDEDELNKIFLNPQSWAVLSRLPSKEQANSAFDEVYKRLFCEFGLISHAPASSKYYPEKKSFFAFTKGVKENGGVFCHANTWAVIAETMLERNDEAFDIYRSTLPSRRNPVSDRTYIEPYVYASAMLGPEHERFGAGSNSWLTGTASWMYFAATQYILGFRPDYDGIVIDPCIPNSWDGFEMTRVYRGIKCSLKVGKLPYKNARIKNVIVDGEKLDGNFVPYELIKDKESVVFEAEF